MNRIVSNEIHNASSLHACQCLFRDVPRWYHDAPAQRCPARFTHLPSEDALEAAASRRVASFLHHRIRCVHRVRPVARRLFLLPGSLDSLAPLAFSLQAVTTTPLGPWDVGTSRAYLLKRRTTPIPVSPASPASPACPCVPLCALLALCGVS